MTTKEEFLARMEERKRDRERYGVGCECPLGSAFVPQRAHSTECPRHPEAQLRSELAQLTRERDEARKENSEYEATFDTQQAAIAEYMERAETAESERDEAKAERDEALKAIAATDLNIRGALVWEFLGTASAHDLSRSSAELIEQFDRALTREAEQRAELTRLREQVARPKSFDEADWLARVDALMEQLAAAREQVARLGGGD